MKGRKLSLEEVLNLEDGTKVWVDYEYGDEHDLCFRSYKDDGLMNCKYPDVSSEGYVIADNIDVYEWFEEGQKSYSVYYKSNKSIITSMAQEICNLRGLDLTDENIDKIVEEFKEEK